MQFLLVKKEQEVMAEVAQLISGRMGMRSSSCFVHQVKKSTIFKSSLAFYRGQEKLEISALLMEKLICSPCCIQSQTRDTSLSGGMDVTGV